MHWFPETSVFATTGMRRSILGATYGRRAGVSVDGGVSSAGTEGFASRIRPESMGAMFCMDV